MGQWGREAKSVSFDNMSFGDYSEVGRHDRDVLFCGGALDFIELKKLYRAAGG